MGMAATKQEAFWEACGFGNIEEVKMYIAMGIDVNWKSYTHNSCAIHVASQGKPEIVQLLIDQKCDVNAKDDRDNLALHHAAMKGHAAIIKMLIKAGSQVDAQDKNGWTALINAAYWCQQEAVQALMDNHCNPHIKNNAGRTALHELCRSASVDEKNLAAIAKILTEVGCQLDAKCADLGEADFTPLMFCGYHGHHLVAQQLIEGGAKINCQGSNGWSALHWAADRNHKEVVKVLLKGGIDPMLRGRRDDTALDRSLDNDTRRILADAMGVEFYELKGTELKLRREALEAERRARFHMDLSDIAIGNNGEEGASGSLPSSPLPPTNGGDVKETQVFQAMQEQMKQMQSQLKTRRLHRQRSMPTRLFAPPRPPSPEKEMPKIEAPVQSIFDTDAIGFIDSDDDDHEPVSTDNDTAAGATGGADSQGLQEARKCNGIAALHIDIPGPVDYLTRGEVTTDEGESDSEDEHNGSDQKVQSCNSEMDSGLSTADNVTDSDAVSPLNENVINDANHMINELENDVNNIKISKPMLPRNVSNQVNGVGSVDEYLDENEIAGGFDEGLE